MHEEMFVIALSLKQNIKNTKYPKKRQYILSIECYIIIKMIEFMIT